MSAHERYDIENADILFEDVWAQDEPDRTVCPTCSSPVAEGMLTCASCGVALPVCVGACGACGLPVCVKPRL